jgi:hypothetical protein
VQNLVEDWPVGHGTAGAFGEHPAAARVLKIADLEGVAGRWWESRA